MLDSFIKYFVVVILLCGCSFDSCPRAETYFTEQRNLFYVDIHNKIERLAEEFALNFPKLSGIDEGCLQLDRIYSDLIQQPISLKRLYETQRIMLLSTECPGSKIPTILNSKLENKQALKCFVKKFPYSNIAKLNAIETESEIITTVKNEEKRRSYTKLQTQLLNLIDNSENDLLPYSFALKAPFLSPVNRLKLKVAYCNKAVQQKQWEHIYNLSRIQEKGSYYLIECLKNNIQLCDCPAAVKIAYFSPPREDLFTSEILNPQAEEILENEYAKRKQDLADAIALYKANKSKSLVELEEK